MQRDTWAVGSLLCLKCIQWNGKAGEEMGQ